MTLRYMSGASIVTLLTCGLATVAPAQAQNGSLLPPEESALITVTGCLQRGGDEGDDTFILASPRLGPVANVPNAACDAAVDSQALELDDADDHGINGSFLGRWIEISGRLEKEDQHRPEQPSRTVGQVLQAGAGRASATRRSRTRTRSRYRGRKPSGTGTGPIPVATTALRSRCRKPPVHLRWLDCSDCSHSREVSASLLPLTRSGMSVHTSAQRDPVLVIGTKELR